MRIDYLIGLRFGDIGDYSPPSEQLYSEIFNETSLRTPVHLRYIPRNSNEILNTDQTSFFSWNFGSDDLLSKVIYANKLHEFS